MAWLVKVAQKIIFFLQSQLSPLWRLKLGFSIQGIPLIDAEIAEKGHFWMKTI